MQTPPLLSGPHNFLLYGSPHNTHIQLYTSTAATVNILINLLIVIEPKFVSSFLQTTNQKTVFVINDR